MFFFLIFYTKSYEGASPFISHFGRFCWQEKTTGIQKSYFPLEEIPMGVSIQANRARTVPRKTNSVYTPYNM